MGFVTSKEFHVDKLNAMYELLEVIQEAACFITK
jgi:hypothetical protein